MQVWLNLDGGIQYNFPLAIEETDEPDDGGSQLSTPEEVAVELNKLFDAAAFFIRFTDPRTGKSYLLNKHKIRSLEITE